MTRWCCVWPALSREREGGAPTSHNDSLVPVWPVWSREKLPMSLYDSLVLVVACVAKGGGIGSSRGCHRWQQLFVLPVSNY